SGKSTLSDLVRCLEYKATSSKFPSSEFTVGIDGGDAITQANVANSSLNIYTFNRDFINENISWNSIVKGRLLVDKEMIEEREKLEKLKKEQEADNKAHSIGVTYPPKINP